MSAPSFIGHARRQKSCADTWNERGIGAPPRIERRADFLPATLGAVDGKCLSSCSAMRVCRLACRRRHARQHGIMLRLISAANKLLLKRAGLYLLRFGAAIVATFAANENRVAPIHAYIIARQLARRLPRVGEGA